MKVPLELLNSLGRLPFPSCPADPSVDTIKIDRAVSNRPGGRGFLLLEKRHFCLASSSLEDVQSQEDHRGSDCNSGSQIDQDDESGACDHCLADVPCDRADVRGR